MNDASYRGVARGRSPRAIVVGGCQNALSVTRNLARSGVEVLNINHPYEAVRFSRYGTYVALEGNSSPAEWEKFLLSPASDHLKGAVLLACSDEAISIIVKNYGALVRKFLLEETEPETRRELLDKFAIYRRAEEANVPTVKYSLVRPQDQLAGALSGLRFPMIMKPLYSPDRHLLKFKAALITEQSKLEQLATTAAEAGVSVVLMEYIPGEDDQLCSYYTYLDGDGQPLVHLTKRVKRRYPLESGDGTYHVTDWIPEAAELGLRFFRHLRFKGLGNIEFKRDSRDGALKTIEVNARFTASDCLITRSGVNLALMTYNRITVGRQSPMLDYRQSLSLCRPIEDALAAWQLHRRGKLQLSEWLAELWRADLAPFFEWKDPLPAFAALGRRAWQVATDLSSKHRAAVLPERE